MTILFIVWLFLQSALQLFLSFGVWIISPWLMLIKWLPVLLSGTWLWYPGYKIDWSLFTPTKETIAEKLDVYKSRVNGQIIDIMKQQDTTKFLGLLSTTDRIYGMKLGVTYMRSQFNRPWNDLRMSSDMFSGLLPGLWFNKDDNHNEFLSKAIDELIYKYPYFRTNGTGGTGYMFQGMFNGDYWLSCLTALATFKDMFPDRRDYKFLYYFTLVISYPFAFINAETSFFVGRIMGTMFYNAHSRAWNCYLAYKITGNRGYRWALARIHRKFPYNPEITALYLLCYPELDIWNRLRLLAGIELWLTNYDDEYSSLKTQVKGYFNVENFSRSLAKKIMGKVDKIDWKTNYHDHILPSKYRNTHWDNSKKPIKNENHRDMTTQFDFIVVEHLYSKIRKIK